MSKVIFGIYVIILMIAFLMFSYSYYIMYKIKNCQEINFNSKSCERYKDY